MSLLITEYEELGRAASGDPVLAGRAPAITTQSVAIGGSSVQSSALAGKTRFVRLYAEAACHIDIGTNPTAVDDETKLGADSPEYFAIPEGDTWKIAVIQD